MILRSRCVRADSVLRSWILWKAVKCYFCSVLGKNVGMHSQQVNYNYVDKDDGGR
jgi:hypothetical protein